MQPKHCPHCGDDLEYVGRELDGEDVFYCLTCQDYAPDVVLEFDDLDPEDFDLLDATELMPAYHDDSGGDV